MQDEFSIQYTKNEIKFGAISGTINFKDRVMSLFGNYNTPGRGVLKAPQEKKVIFKFFESMQAYVEAYGA